MTEDDAPRTHAARQREGLAATLADMADTLDRYEGMICDQARREVELLFPAVLKELSHCSSEPELGSDGWPYMQPLAKSGFLAHLFWARYESDFVHYSDHFQNEVRRACALVVEKKLFEDIACDFVKEARCIEIGAYSQHEAEDWAADHLAKMSWEELLHADMDILSDCGIRDPFHDTSESEDEPE